MNGSSKILTVSYGTFSCTLEGFDDPLGTMRELAEYFRELAADDRYFGAEPPTPDVEMLQNIAQRDVRRKVEARPSAAGVALTQVESDAPDVDEATAATATEKVAAPEPDPAPAEVAETGPLTFDDDFLMADEPEDILAVDPDAAPAVDGPAETVAEKLRRIRAVVSRRPDEADAPFSQPQPETSASRDRAMSETIRQIQSDLADDEDADTAEDKIAAPQTFKVDPASKPLPKASNPKQPVRAAPTIEDEETDDVSAEVQDEGSLEYDAPEDFDTDERSMSQLLESVSERVGEIEAEAPKAISKPLPDGSTDVGRLLEETDSKLNEDGVVRRRQVISQMRAAVAATKADRAVTRLITPEAEDEVQKKAYRNDLSDAVNTTKPLPDQRTKTRSLSGPPLMLVSSQRVAEANDPTETVEQPSAPKDEFANFVQMNNATGLEELLEAAAAYTVFKQGQESFSRPEIMKRVATVDPTLSQSREDGLRSFGQLLRQGKFQKLDRGQFTIDQNTRFNPDKRIAGE